MSRIMFNSEVEQGKFYGSIDVVLDAFQAISRTDLTYEIHTSSSGNNILAFKSCSPDYTTRFLDGKFDLVMSDENLQVKEFIATKLNSSFSINEAALELFQQLGDDLKEQENKYINTPLIITGSGVGGYVAILSTLRLHRAIDVEESINGSKKTKRPICITFGAPLVGDEALQSAIFERPQWKSSFLNVVARKDPVATFFSSNKPYKPFGTYLFCTESGGHAAFEDPDSILPVLDAMNSMNAGNLQIFDYTKDLSSIRRKILYRGVAGLDEFNLNLLRAAITLQLREVGVLDKIPNEQIEKMENALKRRKKSLHYEPTKKLNEMKIGLTYMEWYMTSQKRKGGYYDSYKNDKSRDEMGSHQEIVKRHRFLNQYWKKIVEEKDLMPQKEGTKLRTRWLLGGTNYRRIVEPLDIAVYYKENKVNYIENRPNHYKLLEKWLDEDKKDSKSSEGKRNKAASLTEDSCFWAHVEEAWISLRELVNGEANNDAAKKLEEFEAYVMGEIKKYTVSPDIFLKGSSLMTWWNDYKAHKGTGYDSELARYMNNRNCESYK